MTDTNKLIETYIELRDKKAEVSKEAKRIAKTITEAMEEISLQLGTALGDSESMKFQSGTVFWENVEFIRLKDSEAFLDFVVERLLNHNENFLGMLQKRIASDAVKEYMDVNKGQVPPGIHHERAREIRVRRGAK